MIDLMGKKYYFFGLSILIIIAGFIGFLINGPQLDIQFKGGSIVEIQINDNIYGTSKASSVQIKAEEVVKDKLKMNVSAQISETYNSKQNGTKMDMLKINIPEALTSTQTNELLATLKSEKAIEVKENAEMQVQNVQPFIGKEILNRGLMAIFWASLIIILYIWWRFRIMSGLSAGVMAVLGLFHDALIMLSVYMIFKIPLNDAFIAAFLTILGYSMNDTVIIYDRIRENSNLLRKTPIAELVNKSILQTLARSINTVVTVLICIVTVYIFASVNNIQSIKDFSLPLIVGITSGCYSSIFISSPLWVLWKERQAKKKISVRTAKAKA